MESLRIAAFIGAITLVTSLQIPNSWAGEQSASPFFQGLEVQVQEFQRYQQEKSRSKSLEQEDERLSNARIVGGVALASAGPEPSSATP